MAWGQRSGIGLLQGVALYTGAVLGAGVLTFPALAARQAGPASLLAWAGLVLLSVPLASTFAALAGRYPDAGGVATFAARAFGPRWAAVTGWWFYFTVPVGIPVLGLFGGAYVAAATGGPPGWRSPSRWSRSPSPPTGSGCGCQAASSSSSSPCSPPC